MASASVRLEISEEFFATVDRQLSRMEVIARQPALRAGVSKGLSVIARRVREIVPQPGYPGDKPGVTALRNTVRQAVREYSGKYVVGVVGYNWFGGQHGHIVEHGHRIAKGGTLTRTTGHGRVGTGTVGGFVPGRFYLRKAVDQTRTEFEAAMLRSIDDAIKATEA